MLNRYTKNNFLIAALIVLLVLSLVGNGFVFWLVDKEFHTKVVYRNVPTSVGLTTYQQHCVDTQKDCRKGLTQLINDHRALRGHRPLTLNLRQSTGTDNCAGSMGHSKAMRSAGYIFHSGPKYPHESFAANICDSPFTALKPDKYKPMVRQGVMLIPAARASHAVIPGISTAGENVGAAGGSKWDAMVTIDKMMMDEEPYNGGHFANLMSDTFSQIGIDVRCADGTCYLTEDFTD
jgi:uncharacterized protein YkwD